MGDKANIQTHSAHANLLCVRKTLPKIHPGEILLEEFLNPSGISQHRRSRVMDVPPRCIIEIVHGKRAVTADAALQHFPGGRK